MAAGGRKNADEALALLLAGGRTHHDAAAAARVSERTVRRRLADPRFRERVAALRAAMVERAAAILAEGMAEGAAVLRQLALEGRSEAVRLGAARALLELGVRLRESVELEQRVAALEQNQRG